MNTHRQHAVDRRILNHFWEDSGGIPRGFRRNSAGVPQGFRGIPGDSACATAISFATSGASGSSPIIKFNRETEKNTLQLFEKKICEKKKNTKKIYEKTQRKHVVDRKF